MTTLQNICLGVFILILGLILSHFQPQLGIPSFWTGAIIGAGISIIALSKFLFKKK